MDDSQRYAFEHGPLTFWRWNVQMGWPADAGDMGSNLVAATVAQTQEHSLARGPEQLACPL